MRNTKAIIAALSKDESVSIVKNVTITDIYVGEVDEATARCPIIITLDKEVKGMVRVTKEVIDEAARVAAGLKAEAEDETDATSKAEAEAKAKAAEAYANSLELDEFVEGKTDRVFLSNFAFIGMLRSDPETMFLVDAVRADETVFKRLLNRATMNIIAQSVISGEEYRDPFSSSDSTVVVQNDSVYHSGYDLKLSKYGWEAADEVKQILAEITKARLMAKLGAKLSKKRNTSKSYDEDED